MDDSPRLRRWMARWLTAMPAETHLSLVAMVLGGVFDRIDDRLRICFAHGGGSFAFWLGRMDNAWRGRPDVVGTLPAPASHCAARSSSMSTASSSTPAPCACWWTPYGPRAGHGRQ
ncbi:hypothetical protein [Streptomyces sp. ST1020]|uniref:hypothetical protein n=1 Tax=Streptomyces sp. ST1020 TaxID=1848901 RepID=UPI0034C62D77